jgi:hypothetical protein
MVDIPLRRFALFFFEKAGAGAGSGLYFSQVFHHT